MTTPDPKAVAEAVDRLKRIGAGERARTVYGFDDEEMDDFMYRMLENKETKDLRTLANAWMWASDPTPLAEVDWAAEGWKWRGDRSQWELGGIIIWVRHEPSAMRFDENGYHTVYPQPATLGHVNYLIWMEGQRNA